MNNDRPQFLPDDLRLAIEQIHAAPVKLVIEFAGAGSLALFWLHSVAGSSRTILEATDRYAPTSLADLIGQVPESFVAQETAAAMATAAYRRAMRLVDGAAACIGVACTATIATDRAKRGEHRCWVAVHDSGGVSAYGLVLTKGLRDRLGEEALVSRLMLRAIAEACAVATPVTLDLAGDEQIVTSRTDGADPIRQLLDGSVRSLLVAPDGALTPKPSNTGALLSGSFNPLHAGHERLAQAATAALGLPVTFELPILNADKVPIGYAEIERRLAQFRWRYPVVLSRAPLFVEKADLFPGCVFVIGYDTAARLVEPRYYGGVAARDEALVHIRARGCRFLVAGRVEGDAFRTLADIPLPADAHDLFLALSEQDFRIDLSSTQIRNTMGGTKGGLPSSQPPL